MPDDKTSAGVPDIVLQTTALTRTFGDLTAVDRVTLTVNQGEIFGLIGPNGAGKSTLIKMLTTLLPPTDGTAQRGRVRYRSSAAEVRRHIGYVPQLLSADGSLTGIENMLLSARLYVVPRAERMQRITGALNAHGAVRGRTSSGRALFRRNDPAAGDRPEPAASPAGAFPRRAHGRPRPRRARDGVGARPRTAGQSFSGR